MAGRLAQRMPGIKIIYLSDRYGDATFKNITHYASPAREKGIPALTIHIAELRDLQVKWNRERNDSFGL